MTSKLTGFLGPCQCSIRSWNVLLCVSFCCVRESETKNSTGARARPVSAGHPQRQEKTEKKFRKHPKTMAERIKIQQIFKVQTGFRENLTTVYYRAFQVPAALHRCQGTFCSIKGDITAPREKTERNDLRKMFEQF